MHAQCMRANINQMNNAGGNRGTDRTVETGKCEGGGRRRCGTEAWTDQSMECGPWRGSGGGGGQRRAQVQPTVPHAAHTRTQRKNVNSQHTNTTTYQHTNTHMHTVYIDP
jgi:hypothetical protein